MKGEETLVGRGVRSMTPAYRLVLTATPVKNRLPDIFRLA
jgi:SNF2 family DNA or RNA helicase